jgi:hypothetical protein
LNLIFCGSFSETAQVAAVNARVSIAADAKKPISQSIRIVGRTNSIHVLDVKSPAESV